MSNDKRIRPAMSPEEWKARVAERVTAAGHPYAITAHHNQLELHGITGSRHIPDELRFAVAAFCLEGQSFGFWRGDVLDEIEASRYCKELADLVSDEATSHRLREQAHRHIERALRIAAFLPPDIAAEGMLTSATDRAGSEATGERPRAETVDYEPPSAESMAAVQRLSEMVEQARRDARRSVAGLPPERRPDRG